MPLISPVFAQQPGNSSIFTASVVLAVMIVPFIAATMRDVSPHGAGDVQGKPRSASAAPRGEVMRNIVLPYTRSAVVGGIMLGAGARVGGDDGG